MNTVGGVSIGAGSAILAYVVAKFEIAEKVYSFIKKLFGEKATVNVENVSGTVGDVAGRDIHKNKYDQSRRRSGDIFQTTYAPPSRPVLKRTVRLQFEITEAALRTRLREIWDQRDLPGAKDWFIEYVDAVLDSDEFLERVASVEARHARDGWELESIDAFDNTWNNDNHGFHCQMTFAKALPRRVASAIAV
jgi:hypothetical protein